MAPALLEKWVGDATSAPGRLTSSPWPDHIDVQTIEREPDGGYSVMGEVVERTSADAAGGAAGHVPVRLELAKIDHRWLIVRYDEWWVDSSGAAGQAADQHATADPTNVVRAYYRAIDGRRYADAYRLWESKGAASGKSFEEFRSGFSQTVAVEVMPGNPGRIEGAAGSQYVEIPVRVVARLRNGAVQVFAGTYTLRRSVVDGAAREQRTWHIHSARLRPMT